MSCCSRFIMTSGKTWIPESSNLGRGYSAVYYLNSTGYFNIAASVLYVSNDTLVVDIPLPQVDWLNALRYNTEWLQSSLTHATAKLKLSGQSYVMSAQVSKYGTY
jgi:hypothetical protein